MVIQWQPFTQPDGRDHRQILVSDTTDWSIFDWVAQTLEVGLGGTWTEKLGGEDARYWDLDVAGGKITLHLQECLGITVYPTDGADADPQSLVALEQAHRLLTSPSDARLPVSKGPS
jgi:hypothetical protein